jgi:Mor family transcriptional regulator
MNLRSVAPAIVVAVAAAGCGGADGGADVDRAAPAVAASTSEASTTTTSTTTTTTKGAPDPSELTLADFVPFAGPQNSDDAQQFYRDQEMLVQESVRACMAEEGFEYIPYVASADHVFFGGDDFDQEEWAATYGFGYTVGLLEGDADPFGTGGYEPEDDPNFAITEAMTHSEREAYFHTLYGEDVDLAFEDATQDELAAAWEDREWKGCYQIAAEETFAGQDFYLDFGDELEELYARVQADPRIVELESRWSSCMAEAGFDYRDQEEMYRYLDGRIQEIVGVPDTGFVTDFAVEVVENEDGSVTYFDEAGNEVTEEQMAGLTGPDHDEAALLAFRDEEISTAVADAACSKELSETFEAVYTEYDRRFVQENLAALKAWKAAASSITP